MKDTRFSDNREALSPLEKDYWQASLYEVYDLKKICIAAFFAALSVALQSIKLPLTSSLQIQITFFISALAGCILGPVLSLVRGAVADVVGFFLFPSGAFFFGYTLSAMLSSMTYSLFLYRRKISLWRILCAKGVVSIFMNVALGSLWSVTLYGKKTYLGYFALSLAKNAVLYPLECAVIFLLISALIPVLCKMRLCPNQEKPKLELRALIAACALFAVIAVFAICLLFFKQETADFFAKIYKSAKDFFNRVFVR